MRHVPCRHALPRSLCRAVTRSDLHFTEEQTSSRAEMAFAAPPGSRGPSPGGFRLPVWVPDLVFAPTWEVSAESRLSLCELSLPAHGKGDSRPSLIRRDQARQEPSPWPSRGEPVSPLSHTASSLTLAEALSSCPMPTTPADTLLLLLPFLLLAA